MMIRCKSREESRINIINNFVKKQTKKTTAFLSIRKDLNISTSSSIVKIQEIWSNFGTKVEV